MKVKNIGSNQTEVTCGDVTILFSYETPVAARINNEYFKTETEYSATTTKHVNRWAGKCPVKPQAFFDTLLKERG